MKRTLCALALALSCGDNNPCSTCPAAAGTWALSLDAAMATGCSGMNGDITYTFDTPAAVLTFDEQGSVLHASYDGADLRGTLYDSFQFTLNGSQSSLDAGSDNVVEIQARYVPPSKPGLTDDTLVDGQLNRSYSTCDELRTFTAHRSTTP